VADPGSDDAFVRWVADAGLLSIEQIESARKDQHAAAERGVNAAIVDILVQQGALTPSQRENIEKRLRTAACEGGHISGYTLSRRLGEGGMGIVYLGADSATGQQVAVKVLPGKYAGDPVRLARFRREAQAASRLLHENIARAYSAGEDNGQYYYAMEYVNGEPLDRFVTADRLLPIKRVLEIIIQVARGLEYAHRNGIIHRDIKPGNIFVTPDGRAKILDFGLSKDILDQRQSFMTESGIAVGTAHYISPEQARGEKAIDGRADIYSLGATFYHLLTGRTPFEGSSPVVVITKHLTEQLANPKELNASIPDGVVLVLQKMMAKAPGDRHLNCADLIKDLELVAAGQTPSSQELAAQLSTVTFPARGLSSPQGQPAPVPILLSTVLQQTARRKRNWRRIGLGVAAFVVLSVGVFWGAQYASRPSAEGAPEAESAGVLKERIKALEAALKREGKGAVGSARAQDR